MGQVFKKSWKF